MHYREEARKIIADKFASAPTVPGNVNKEEMPYFQKVYDKCENNPEVMFMMVNSGSNNTIDDARKWVKKNTQYSFPIYFNTDKNIGEKVGFTLIPTIAVIDKAGKMQFRTIGFEGPILEKKLAVEIDLLLGEQGKGGIELADCFTQEN